MEDVGTNKPREKEETEQKVDGETGLWSKAAKSHDTGARLGRAPAKSARCIFNT